MTPAIASRLRARRTSGAAPRIYRLANSIRLPFAVGVTGFLVLALGVGLLVGRVVESELEVPGAVRALQASVAREVAESARRGLNEGVDDLEQLARELLLVDDAEAALVAFADIHGRYESVYLLDENGRILAAHGSVPPAPQAVEDRDLDEPGMVLHFDGDRPIISQHAPVQGGGGTVVGQYTPVFLRYAMNVAAPGDAWLVDRRARVIAGLGGAPPGTRLQHAELDAAAHRATAGSNGASVLEGGVASHDVVAWSPVRGVGVAGSQDWGVVTARRVDAARLGAPSHRRQSVALAIAVAITAVAVFAWLRAVVLVPTTAVQREAERLAYGDLSSPVTAQRYDEIGIIARALERIRVLLIRHRMRRS